VDISGTVAIVTGGGSGLGRYFCVGLAAAGARVLVADLDAEAAERTAADIHGHAVTADVTDPAEAHRLIRVAAEKGGPHILINNAGGWSKGGEQYPVATPDLWGAALDLNLRTPMLLSQACLKPMGRLGGGAILNIASSAALGDDAYGSPEYAASKAGLIRFTASCGDLEKTHAVRMTCIVPGWIGLERAAAEFAALPVAERTRTHLVPPEKIVRTGLDLIRSGRGGAVVEML
jgi:NAD(P)-dependent dehydrogenase (short-subunit alcohol dehydrogenase family)